MLPRRWNGLPDLLCLRILRLYRPRCPFLYQNRVLCLQYLRRPARNVAVLMTFL
jgi:Fe-S-cluster containining protein